MTSATKWRVVTLPGSELVQIWNQADQVVARISTREKLGAELPDARLIAEAGTVFHECGLSPRELLEGYRELRAAVLDLMGNLTADPKSCGHQFHCTCSGDRVSAALAKHKEV